MRFYSLTKLACETRKRRLFFTTTHAPAYRDKSDCVVDVDGPKYVVPAERKKRKAALDFHLLYGSVVSGAADIVYQPTRESTSVITDLEVVVTVVGGVMLAQEQYLC